MSFGGAPAKCPSKSVYHAEQALGPGGVKYHKICFRCGECGKSLDSMNMTEAGDQLLCKPCYGKLHGPKGYGFGGGAGLLQTGKYTDKVDAVAEPVTFGAHSSTAGPVAPRDQPQTITTTTTTTTVQTVNRFGGGAKPQFGGTPKCPRCGKSVYAAEQVMGPNSVPYHKLCFRCGECGKSLDSMNVTEHDGVIMCKGCYSSKHGPKGYGYGGGAGTLQQTQ